jgi:branched-chain amino acid aminotransferase
MQQCLLNYFIFNDELKSSCDFNPQPLLKVKGVYEVFRVIDGVPLFLNEHIYRYYSSLRLGGYKPDHSREQLIKRLKTLIESNQVKQANIQFQYSKINDSWQFLAWVTSAIYPSSKAYENGVDLLSLNAVRELPHLKSLNLPAREKANKLIAEEGIFEVLLVGDDGTISEGSRSNIFFVKDNKLFTTSLSLILDGITRSNVLSVAKTAGIGVTEKLISFDSINRFEAAFLTSTSMKVLPVRKIDTIRFTPDNQLVKQLMKLYDKQIQIDLNQFSWNKL